MAPNFDYHLHTMSCWRKLDRRFVQSILCIAVFVLISSCQRRAFLSQHNWVDKDSSIAIGPTAHDSISIHYIGCSGFFITKDTTTLLFDPYFTYRQFWTPRLTTEDGIRCKTEWTINKVFRRAIGSTHDERGVIDAVIIDHGHLDHFGDVPYLYESGHIADSTKVYGNETVGHYVRGHKLHAKLIDSVEASAATYRTPGRWIYVNSRVRLLPIISEHAPHFKLFGRGYTKAATGSETKDTTHTKARDYATGQTLAYLVDFLSADSAVNFRIYHSSAGSSAPLGFVPQAVLDTHRVDLAILCAASFAQADNYPENIIEHLKPRHILFAHWEDFIFASHHRIKKYPQANHFYNFRKLFRRTDSFLAHLHPDGDTIGYTVPQVDTKMAFYY